jgi:hypothetical protein
MDDRVHHFVPDAQKFPRAQQDIEAVESAAHAVLEALDKLAFGAAGTVGEALEGFRAALIAGFGQNQAELDEYCLALASSADPGIALRAHIDGERGVKARERLSSVLSERQVERLAGMDLWSGLTDLYEVCYVLPFAIDRLHSSDPAVFHGAIESLEDELDWGLGPWGDLDVALACLETLAAEIESRQSPSRAPDLHSALLSRLPDILWPDADQDAEEEEDDRSHSVTDIELEQLLETVKTVSLTIDALADASPDVVRQTVSALSDQVRQLRAWTERHGGIKLWHVSLFDDAAERTLREADFKRIDTMFGRIERTIGRERAEAYRHMGVFPDLLDLYEIARSIADACRALHSLDPWAHFGGLSLLWREVDDHLMGHRQKTLMYLDYLIDDVRAAEAAG